MGDSDMMIEVWEWPQYVMAGMLYFHFAKVVVYLAAEKSVGKFVVGIIDGSLAVFVLWAGGFWT